MNVTGPVLRYHGGKFRLAGWVLGFFPPHQCYVEPFGGAASVLLQKKRSYAEVYNDLDGDIVNFFRVLRNQVQRAQLVEALTLTPYARDEFALAYEETADPVERARRTAVRAQMGFGSASACGGQSGFRTDTRRAYATAQHLWSRYPVGLSAVGARFADVLIENRPALEVMRQHDEPTTLHFVDPPYLPDTRVSGNRYYRHEMTVGEHEDLLAVLRGLSGMVVLSGYPSVMYDQSLPGWQRHETTSRISAARGTSVRTEVVWLNPVCVAALASCGSGLFDMLEPESA